MSEEIEQEILYLELAYLDFQWRKTCLQNECFPTDEIKAKIAECDRHMENIDYRLEQLRRESEPV
jgi:hypothetical protein